MALIGRIAGGFDVARCLSTVDQLAPEYARKTDAEVRDACRAFLDAPKLPGEFDHQGESALPRPAGVRLEKEDAEAIAAACEAFARFPPAGITPGTRLYSEQILAAAHLVRGGLVQMDTGEGKTFALMVAALALLRRHYRIYIVTANPYLAMRDAGNTSAFWAALGVSVGVALPSQYETAGLPGWEASVVYTTAETLIFQGQTDDLCYRRADLKLGRAALLVDEVDAVLLDQLEAPFKTIRSVGGSRKNWKLACEVALRLGQEHVRGVPDRGSSLSVYLTAAGQAEVIRLSGSLLGEAQHLPLYHDVELAYTGLREAVEGRDYEIIGQVVVPIDTVSGWRTLTRIPDWVAPLAAHRGLRRSTRTQSSHLTEGYSTLFGFDHFAGTSGTLIGEALDYLLIARLTTVVIPPRNPRHQGVEPELLFRTFDLVERRLCAVVAEQAERRPILVVTSSNAEAYRLAAALRETVPDGVSVKYAYGETFGEQRLFEQAGRARTVVVSTRQAGRGVDIQLDEEARSHGGSLLILIGHATQARLDRQLLGRVGRGGDPYTACFWSYSTDSVMNRLPVARLPLDVLVGDQPLTGNVVARSVKTVQRTMRFYQLQSFAGRIARAEADAELFELLRKWRGLVRESFEDWSVDSSLLDELVRTFLHYHTPGIDGAVISSAQAKIAAAKAMEVCGAPRLARSLELKLVGQDATRARAALADQMKAALTAAVAANRDAIGQSKVRLPQARGAAVGLRWLSAVRRRIDSLSADGAREAEPPTRGVPAPLEADYGKDLVLRSSPLPRWAREARADPPALPVGELERLTYSFELPSLRPLMLAAFSLRRGVASADAVDALARAVVRAEEQLLPLARALPELEMRAHIADRTPAEVAHESIAMIADMLDSSRTRLWFDLSQRQLEGLRYQNAYLSGTRDLRKIAESALVELLCRNLARDPADAALDELFDPRDNAVADPALPRLSLSFTWHGPVSPADGRRRERPVPHGHDDLIEYYVDAVEAAQSYRGLDREDLVPALRAVLGDSPLATLADPAGVAEALSRWRDSEIRTRRMTPWRRRRVDQGVRGFIDFLHEQGLSARMPVGLQERTLPLRRRLAERLAAPRAQLGIMFGGVIALLAWALTAVHPRSAPRLSGLERLADLALAAGRLSAGQAVAVVLLSVGGTAVVSWLLGNFGDGAGTKPFERPLLCALAFATAVPLAWAPGRGWPLACVIMLGLVLAAVLLASLVWSLENITRVYLTAGVIGLSCLCCALPALARQQHDALVLVVGAVGIATFGIRRLVPLRLPVYSLRWSGTGTDASEITAGSLVVPVRIGWQAHAYALVTASLVGSVSGSAAWLTATVYFLVSVSWVGALARSVTRPEPWTRRLRDADRGYAGTDKRPDLAAGLARLRRAFVAREVGVAAAYVGCVAALGREAPLFGGATMNLGLVAGFLGLMGAELSWAAFLSVRNIVRIEHAVASPVESDALSESMLAEFQSVVKRYSVRLSVLGMLYFALAKYVELREVLDLLKEGFDTIRRIL